MSSLKHFLVHHYQIYLFVNHRPETFYLTRKVEGKMLSLNIKVRLVLFAPLYLCPYTLVIKHEESFENGITTGNFRSDLDIFREENARRECVANSKQSPNESFC
mmetsp:Transcript_49054/g.49407  ORF Transcript_49054/g.49407 Transcript_49054/m.49407 type:complete len:104 (-) Transcript_49054:143-454(-)